MSRSIAVLLGLIRVEWSFLDRPNVIRIVDYSGGRWIWPLIPA